MRIVPPRRPGSTRPMRATRHSPHRENLRPTPWRRSPNRRHRTLMYRIILFLLLIALAAAGAAWVADQTGEVVLSWGGLRLRPPPPGVCAAPRAPHRRREAGVGYPRAPLAPAGRIKGRP